MTVRPVQARADEFTEELFSKLRARRFPHRPDLGVWADCTCGWSGPTWWCEGEVIPAAAAQGVREDRAGHEAETGHGEDPDLGAEGRHTLGCRFYHGLNDACPLPASSPRGRVHRIGRSTLNDRHAALDRLRAIDELRTWLAEQEREAVVGARLGQATWAEMGAAVGVTRQGAFNRWGSIVKNLEAAGVLRGPPEPPAPVPPVDPTAGPTDARSWCRWCGHRVVIVDVEGGRWAHHEPDGVADEARVIDVPECPGPEPWPSSHPWYGDAEAALPQ